MALASITYPSVDGATTTFAVPFAYIDAVDVKVYIDGVEDTTFTWPDSATVQPTTTPGAGTDVLVQRFTKQDSRHVDFQDASVLTEADLDKDSRQNFFLMQEQIDDFGDTMQQVADGTLDADSRRIKNLATPTAAADAVTKAYTDAISAAAGNVPTPDNPGDDGRAILASGGTFDWTDITAASIFDASANSRSLIQAANYAAMRALFTPLTANGDLWTRTGGVDARLAVGSAAQVPVSNGTGLVYANQWGWEVVDTVTASGDSLFEFFHDGIDNAGTDLQDGYEYCVDLHGVYGSAEGTLITQLYENGAYRDGTGTDDYLVGGHLVDSSLVSKVWSTGISTPAIGYPGDAVTEGVTGRLVFYNLASTTNVSRIFVKTACIRTTTSYVVDHYIQPYATNMQHAATKFKVFPQAGTLGGGTLVWSRRRTSA